MSLPAGYTLSVQPDLGGAPRREGPETWGLAPNPRHKSGCVGTCFVSKTQQSFRHSPSQYFISQEETEFKPKQQVGPGKLGHIAKL